MSLFVEILYLSLNHIINIYDFRHAIHKRKKHHKFGPETVMSVPNIDSISGSYSVHDFHKFSIHQNGVCPTLHFHLAGSINPETGKRVQLNFYLATMFVFCVYPTM